METHLKSIEDLYGMRQGGASEPKKLVLAVAQDKSALGAVLEAEKQNIILPILVGNEVEIRKIVKDLGFDLGRSQIINEPDDIAAVRCAVKMCHDGEAQVLMKGAVKTPDLLRVVLDKEIGLRKGKLLSHFALFEVSRYHKLIAMTDVALNIAPSLPEKVGIVENSVNFMHRLGIACPKVAALGAIEVVNEKMSATMDAALLSKMNDRDQIKGCLIDGPLAFDNAVSSESARIKKIKSDVAGDSDLLLLPDIEMGNVLYKSLVFFADTKVAAVILGASVPIVLTSRADSEEAKLNSILLATF